MEKASIIDVTGLNKDGLLTAHMPKVASNYYRVLSQKYSTTMVGGPAYEKQFRSLDIAKLPFDTPTTLQHGNFNRMKVKIHEVINTICSLKENSTINIFQCYSRLTPILIGVLIGWHKGQRVFLIQYFTAPRINSLAKKAEKILFRINKKRITGIICTSQKVAERFDVPSIVVPDYFYFEDEFTNDNNNSYVYDFGILGQIGIGKRVEDVISAFSGRSEKVLIAGKFSSNERFEKCKNEATNNITIINKYLSEEEYDIYFTRCKSIILPYATGYNEHSSGVVLDALFRKKPVLGTKVEALELISSYQMGYLYDDLNFAIDKFNACYETYRSNINVYLKKHEDYKKELLDFLDQA